MTFTKSKITLHTCSCIKVDITSNISKPATQFPGPSVNLRHCPLSSNASHTPCSTSQLQFAHNQPSAISITPTTTTCLAVHPSVSPPNIDFATPANHTTDETRKQGVMATTTTTTTTISRTITRTADGDNDDDKTTTTPNFGYERRRGMHPSIANLRVLLVLVDVLMYHLNLDSRFSNFKLFLSLTFPHKHSWGCARVHFHCTDTFFHWITAMYTSCTRYVHLETYIKCTITLFVHCTSPYIPRLQWGLK